MSQQPPFLQNWVLACCAAFVSESSTYPLDLVKTRLQLQNERGKSINGKRTQAPLRSMTGIMRDIVVKEGVLSMFSGLSIAILRQCFNAGVSVGLYPYIRLSLCSGEETKETVALWKRALAGSITGCVGQTLAQPTDVVKVRVQADGRLRAAGLTPRYKGIRDAFSRILAEEGVAGFYTALGSSVWRAGIINAAGIASYDGTKHWVAGAMREGAYSPGFQDHAPSFIAAFVCGVVSTVVSCPLDVVKTRLMNSTPGTYRSPGDCFVQLVKEEGLISMWKGIVPTYQRQALWNGIFWVALENFQRALDIERL